MGSVEPVSSVAMTIGGIDLLVAVTVIASVFLAFTVLVFVALAFYPQDTGQGESGGSNPLEGMFTKNALIGLATAATGMLWMLAVLTMAGSF